jgi:hypothetical protein
MGFLGKIKKVLSPFGQGGLFRGDDRTEVDWQQSLKTEGALSPEEMAAYKAATEVGSDMDWYGARQYAQQTAAPQIGYGAQAQARDYQQQAATGMMQAMAGLGSSITGAQKGLALGQLGAQLGGGVGAATDPLAARQAMMGATQSAGGVGAQIGQQALAEQAQLTGGYGGMLGQMRTQDYDIGQRGAEMSQQAAMFNAAQQNQMMQALAQQQLEAGTAAQQLEMQRRLGYDEMALQKAMSEAGFSYQGQQAQRAADLQALGTAMASMAK